MEILAIVPARGGSRSIPRKNTRILGGKPLIAYSIEQAISSKLINRVIVSTDDPEIAAVARKYGAQTPFLRPKKFAQDKSPDILLFKHALGWLKEHESYEPDLIVHLRPTCPLRNVKVVDRAIRKMIKSPQADSLRSVSLSTQTPYKMWRINNSYLKQILKLPGVKEPYNLPRQRLPLVFWQNGYIDIVRPNIIMKRNVMHGRNILAFVIEDEMIDIDYKEHLIRAQRMFNKMKKELSNFESRSQYRKKIRISKWAKRFAS